MGWNKWKEVPGTWTVQNIHEGSGEGTVPWRTVACRHFIIHGNSKENLLEKDLIVGNGCAGKYQLEFKEMLGGKQDSLPRLLGITSHPKDRQLRALQQAKNPHECKEWSRMEGEKQKTLFCHCAPTCQCPDPQQAQQNQPGVIKGGAEGEMTLGIQVQQSKTEILKESRARVLTHREKRERGVSWEAKVCWHRSSIKTERSWAPQGSSPVGIPGWHRNARGLPKAATEVSSAQSVLSVMPELGGLCLSGPFPSRACLSDPCGSLQSRLFQNSAEQRAGTAENDGLFMVYLWLFCAFFYGLCGLSIDY